MKKIEKLQERKQKIKDLKFQKDIEKTKENIESKKEENRKKIDEVRKLILEDLDEVLVACSDDKQIKLLQWLNYWNFYLATEETFDSNRLRTYKRGDILHVNLGFNVHNELGGLHYAVVVEADNPSTSGSIVIVPLRSEDSETATLNSLHEQTEVYLGTGVISFGKGKEKYTVAKVNQIRAIDKMRIFKPKNDKNDEVYPKDEKMRKEILDKIDSKIIELLTKQKKLDKTCI